MVEDFKTLGDRMNLFLWSGKFREFSSFFLCVDIYTWKYLKRRFNLKIMQWSVIFSCDHYFALSPNRWTLYSPFYWDLLITKLYRPLLNPSPIKSCSIWILPIYPLAILRMLLRGDSWMNSFPNALFVNHCKGHFFYDCVLWTKERQKERDHLIGKTISVFVWNS